MYTHDIKRLRELISNYLQRKEAVWVLFDNLDKGWSTVRRRCDRCHRTPLLG